MGIATVTMVLNESRQQRNLSSVSYHAVQYYVKTSQCVNYKKRLSKKEKQPTSGQTSIRRCMSAGAATHMTCNCHGKPVRAGLHFFALCGDIRGDAGCSARPLGV